MNRIAPCSAWLTCGLLASLASLTTTASAQPPELASYALDVEVKLSNDVRNRAISDSLLSPGARVSVQVAHESGLVGVAELASVSKKQFFGSQGYSLNLGVGYRFGDPEGWHFGLGLATEVFPGASFDAPHTLNLETFEPEDFRKTRYDSRFAMLEAGYGDLELRLLPILSKTYRGIDTGGVCATLLQFNPDPSVGLNCYARGEHHVRGSLLTDLSYKWPLNPSTTLNLHAGKQQIRHFSEANYTDYSLGLSHHHWGLDMTAEWISPHTQARELYLAVDGNKLRATDTDKLVVTVAHKF